MKAHLIQRGKFEKREGKEGIDSILRFDYMGSSEFEWGALPESLTNIRSKIEEYVYLDVPIYSKTITVFCKESQKADVKQYLLDLAMDKFNLKEYSDFNNYVNPSAFKSRTDFWWDISNHLMFWRKDVDFETNFKEVINRKKQ